MVRHTFDPDGDILLTLAIPADRVLEVEKTSKRTESGGRNLDNGEDHLAEHSSVEMLVSSKHIALASPVFRAMLKPHFAEGLTLQSSGHATIPLFDDDPYALEVVMNIVHCQLKKVPQKIALNQFTHVAVLVDKYQLHDMVDYFAQIWIQNLEEKLPSWAIGFDLHPWLCISWVFKMRDLFTRITKLAILSSTGTLYRGPSKDYPIDLPIPEAVFEKIECERIRGIKSALSIIEGAIKKYQNNAVIHCPRSQTPPVQRINNIWIPESIGNQDKVNLARARLCDSATLGALIKGALAEDIYPLPSSPYVEISNLDIAGRIGAIAVAVPSYCEERSGTKSCHDLKQSIPSALHAITVSIVGFDPETVLLSKPTEEFFTIEQKVTEMFQRLDV